MEGELVLLLEPADVQQMGDWEYSLTNQEHVREYVIELSNLAALDRRKCFAPDGYRILGWKITAVTGLLATLEAVEFTDGVSTWEQQ